MTRGEAYTILDRLIVEKKIFSPTVECAIAMALDDMMVVEKLGHLKNGMIGLIEEIKGLEDVRGEE